MCEGFECGSNSTKVLIYLKNILFENTSCHVVDLVNFMKSGSLQKVLKS
jgi:hypothetical protein